MISLQRLLLCSVLCLLLHNPSVHAGTSEEGLAFLEENKQKDGVVVLDSGLQYRVLESGNGTHHPAKATPCLCHYHGTLTDGTVFDSSYDRGSPTTFAPSQVIKGWTEAMQLMVEGDKWELTIPSELAYGDRGSGQKIPGGSVLQFIIEILEIQGEKVPAMKCNVKTYDKCNDKEVEYVAKVLLWDDDAKPAKEIERLSNMQKSGKMKPELKDWISRRIYILKQFVAPPSRQEEAEKEL